VTTEGRNYSTGFDPPQRKKKNGTFDILQGREIQDPRTETSRITERKVPSMGGKRISTVEKVTQRRSGGKVLSWGSTKVLSRRRAPPAIGRLEGPAQGLPRVTSRGKGGRELIMRRGQRKTEKSG